MAGLDSLRTRLQYAAGGKRPTQENINTQNKLLSMQSSLTNAEQLEHVSVGVVTNGVPLYGRVMDCLINPDKLAVTYDQKEISIDPTKSSLEEGNIVRWYRGSNNWWNKEYTDWLVIMRDLEEKAYIRARIRRCNYEVDVDGFKYKIALTGPQETAIIWRQKHQIEMNDLNYAPYFYVTKDEITNNFFKRFQIVKFDGHRWRAATVDRYSSDGVLMVHLEEYFDNEMEDAMVEIKPIEVDPRTKTPYIEGSNIVRPYDVNLTYSIKNISGGSFVVSSDKVEISKLIKISSSDENTLKFNIITGKSNEFKISYMIGDEEIAVLPITIKSL